MTEPYYEDNQVTLLHGDCLDLIAAMPNASIDAVVTDPPYGIGFMGKEWDQPGEFGSTRRNGTPGLHRRVGKYDHQRTTLRAGAMEAGRYDFSANAKFQNWCTAWASECLRVLKPGGHLLSFGGSRTWHRLASAIEDAGFDIRDSIAWLYGSGFPKSRDVTEAMEAHLAGDRAAAPTPQAPAPRLYRITYYLREARDAAGWTNRQIDELLGTNGMAGHWTTQRSQPAVPSVRQWAILKEALGMGDEMDELVQQIGAAERDDGGSSEDRRAFLGSLHKGGERKPAGGWGTALKPAFEPVVVGRKPFAASVTANVHDYGVGALNIAACRVCPQADLVCERCGEDMTEWHRDACDEHLLGQHSRAAVATATSRHFDEGCTHVGPAGRWPTNVVLDESQAAELDKQAGVRTSGYMKAQTDRKTRQGDIYGRFAARTATETYGDSGGASRYFPVFRYEAKAPSSQRPRDGEIAHPTVKPLDLIRWLVRLVTPPGGTVLEPFAGSGTTAEACVIEGLRCIAIEREIEYLPLIVQRLTKPIQMGLDFDGAAS